MAVEVLKVVILVGMFLRRDARCSARFGLAPRRLPPLPPLPSRISFALPPNCCDCWTRHSTSDQRQHQSSLSSSTSPKMSKSTKSAKGGKAPQRSAIEDVVAREYTIHLHKRVRSV